MERSEILPDKPIYPGSDQYDDREMSAPGSKPLSVTEIAPLARVEATAWIAFNVPDLDRQEAFLKDFGLELAGREEGAIYFRGAGSDPWCYVARRAAKAGFAGVAFSLADGDDLGAYARQVARPVEDVSGPGGGRCVRLTDPDGFEVHVVSGRSSVEPLPVSREAPVLNTPDSKARIGKPVRPALAPTPVFHFGHCVLMVTDFKTSWAWYRRHLGLLPSDVLCTDSGEPVVVFGRLDRGATPVDHHSLVLMQGILPNYMHSAFETLDIDAIGQGNQYLQARGWTHQWGMGRHILGSQLFDYWLDPWGHEVEHYADGDVFTSEKPPGYHLLDRGGLWAWGDNVPASMKPRPTLRELLAVLRRLRQGSLSKHLLDGMKRAMSRPPRPWLK